jgi:hypothetical protein
VCVSDSRKEVPGIGRCPVQKVHPARAVAREQLVRVDELAQQDEWLDVVVDAVLDALKPLPLAA